MPDAVPLRDRPRAIGDALGGAAGEIRDVGEILDVGAVPDADEAGEATPGPASVPLIEPRDGVPQPVTTVAGLAATAAVFAAARGPVAVDAERASGYRYGQSVYLVQLRRDGAGTALIDPVGCPDLSSLGAALADTEWVLHAASQDLPCLADVGMRPVRLFDTELAGRLLGYPRVGLGAMVESVLGFRLEKGHSAADWSTRPLPEPWLRYAALDVEVLIELRDALARELDDQGKRQWAEQEFAAIATAPPAPPRVDPWRRVSGLHRIHKRRQLAVVRSLWAARDDIARRRDIAPGRILPDAAIVDAASRLPGSVQELVSLPVFGGRSMRRSAAVWYAAISGALALEEAQLPGTSLEHDGPPPARSWAERDPAAAERLTVTRAAVAALADEHRLPTENLLAPDSVRRLAWGPPHADSAAVGEFLAALGARPWQVELTAAPIAKALLRLAARPKPLVTRE